MILNIDQFIAEESPFWKEFETLLKRVTEDTTYRMEMDELKRFHYLYNRLAADLTKLSTFSTDSEIKPYLENLVARGYGYIHETRTLHKSSIFYRWFTIGFPQAFRRNLKMFWASLLVTVFGAFIGGAALLIDPTSKEIIMPFPHLLVHPSERVAYEETPKETEGSAMHGTFAAQLMTHNTQVSIFTMALGITAGIGTVITLFYNGVILGAVCFDFIFAGYTPFLLGWLLPHGAVEISAILIAGQGGLLIAQAIIGTGKSYSLRQRLRNISTDIMILIGGVALLLVWAGIIESFLSQYHEPYLPYEIKILFGVIELFILYYWLFRAGRSTPFLNHSTSTN